jgi:hypothetical protein
MQIQEDDSWQHRKLRNFLNFQERNPQTTSSMGRQRDRGLNTEPPVTNSISGQTKRACPAAALRFRQTWNIIIGPMPLLLSSMPLCAHAGSCSQVEIYDAYVVDLDAKRAAAEAKAQAERVRAHRTHGR